MRFWRNAERAAAALSLFAVLASGCDDEPKATGEAPAAAAPTVTATAPSPAPADTAPEPTPQKPSPKPYEGPTGTVSGTVTIEGEAPKTPFSYPKGCEAAAGMYGKLFRKGQDGGLADALVAVTDYGKKWVPPESEAVELAIENCAYSQRTVALTNGQHIEIRNRDSMRSYLPHLAGARLPASIVAVPQGPPVKLHTRGLSRYWLRDQMGRDFMVAHVFHLPYATTDVTGLSGQYEIEGVPVGKAKVSVLVPQLNMKRVSKDIEVEEGDNDVDFQLTFDKEKDLPADGHGGTKPEGLPKAPEVDDRGSEP